MHSATTVVYMFNFLTKRSASWHKEKMQPLQTQTQTDLQNQALLFEKIDLNQVKVLLKEANLLQKVETKVNKEKTDLQDLILHVTKVLKSLTTKSVNIL